MTKTLTMMAMLITAAIACAEAGAADPSWTSGPNLPAPRYQHQALALANGGVMVVGGLDDGFAPLRTALISDGRLAGWSVSRTFDRVDARACVLASGKVLVTGGRYDGAGGDAKSATCELYDPSSGTWSPTGALHVGRYLHVIEALADGGAVVIGGISDATDPMDPGNDHIAHENPIERFDPATGHWTALPAIVAAASATSVTLSDGRVLVMGGFRGMDSGSLDPGGWMFDPADNSARVAGSWSASGYWVDFALAALPEGRALRAGGVAYYDPDAHATASAEIFDPSTDSWTPTGSMTRAHVGHALARLGTSGYLDADGVGTEIYDSGSGSWTAGPANPHPSVEGTLTRLHDGRLIAIGGRIGSSPIASTTILSTPASTDPATTPSDTPSGSGPSSPALASSAASGGGHGCGVGGAIAGIAMALASGLRTRRLPRPT